ncbi:GvpL/GvpF family gas vesicle protein [Plantactinospora solaniradicis]|uniref:GvpL/GvpF family gas vesicle protein n=1 Tax=Plantactinospora solaniradicis TaxID=1723736 RepID=A0ABW1KI86_9ACTN
MTDDRGVWVHAMTRGLRDEGLVGVSGAGGSPVRTVQVGGLVAVVADVDLDDYGEAALRRNLGDLAWLESAATAHHRVAEAVWRHGPVVPTRLGTVYRDEAALRTELADRRVDLTATLDRLADRTEWGVKAYASRDRRPTGQPDDADGASPASTGVGTDYLRRRRARLAAGEATARAAVDSAEAVHTMLTRYAEAARRHRPQDRGLSGVPDWMVLNGAYLVHAERGAEFGELVRTLGTRYPGLRLELTGPWPPYSFATLGQGEST